MTTQENKINKKLLNTINSYIKKAVLAKNAYRENIQTAFEIWIAHYNTDLCYNKTVLIDISKALSGKDKQYFYDYVKKATNIKQIRFGKDKLDLVFDNVKDSKAPLQYDNGFIDNNKWYDKVAKEDNKAVFDDNSFLKSLKALLTKADKNGIKKDFIKQALSNANKSIKA